MSPSISILALLLGIHGVVAAPETSQTIEITRNIAIIGGGASGTYAAIRLHEDLKKSVVVIETQPNLGGHTNTYHIPDTNTTVDYGVQSYLPYGPATAFFARFNISTEIYAPDRLNSVNVDVSTGKLLDDYVPPSANATNEAFARWLTITLKYRDYLEPGYWNFPLPQDIPEDFLLPFEQFAKRENIEAAVPRIIGISGVGLGGVRDILTLTVLQAFGASLTEAFLDRTMFHTTGYDNELIYTRALSLLTPTNVLLSSTVQSTERTTDGIHLTVKQGEKTYIITAKRILFTAAPSLSNLSPFQPDAKQTSIFKSLVPNTEFVAVMKANCLPSKTSISYLPPAAVPANQLALRDWPYSLRLDATGPPEQHLFRVIFGANCTLSVDEFKTLVSKSVKDMVGAGAVNAAAAAAATTDGSECDVEFKAVSDHSRPWWPQDAKVLRDGFVQKMYGLQGYRDMWFTGYAWCAPYSSTVWAYTDTVLERMLDRLDG